MTRRGAGRQSENLLKWVNKVSEEALDATVLAAAPEPEIRALATCFAKYQELLHDHNSLDFSGIQYEALKLLEQRTEVLAQLRERLTHLMVDEYQDTNTIQERILLLLAGENKNLCVVGDDDQGLYRFRGATIRNILEFPALFDDGQCKQVKLTVNYRSHPDIIRFYNDWMKEQIWDDGSRVFRFAKQIVPRDDDFPDMPTAVRLAASDGKGDTTNWHAEVLAFLNGLKASGQLADWNQVAFLFRSVKNDKVVALARFLESEGVPVFSPRSNMFFDPLDHIKNFDFWRLFYTAFSRAQNLLVLAAQEKHGHGRSPSKYFDRLFYELPNWHDVNLSALTFEAVKQINLKREYSFTSHITVFENCAEQYRFFKELEFNPIRAGAQLFGTLVHQTIEDIHKSVLRGEESTVTPDQIRSWLTVNYQYLSKRERQYLAQPSLKAVEDHVLRYYEREKDDWSRIKEAEVEISLIKDQYILKGSVDLIRGDQDTVEIIDFKSEKKPDMEKDRDRLLLYQSQLEVYAHLVEERTGQKVSRMHLYYTGEDGGNPYV